MRKVIQITLEEFTNLQNVNWRELSIGDFFVAKAGEVNNDKWYAFEVTDIKHGYGNSAPETVRYDLQIIN